MTGFVQTGVMKKFYRVDEVAYMFGLSKSHVYEMIKVGRLQAWHPEKIVGSRGIRITIESIIRFEQEGLLEPE